MFNLHFDMINVCLELKEDCMNLPYFYLIYQNSNFVQMVNLDFEGWVRSSEKYLLSFNSSFHFGLFEIISFYYFMKQLD